MRRGMSCCVRRRLMVVFLGLIAAPVPPAIAQSAWSAIWPPRWISLDDRSRVDDVVNDVVAIGIGDNGRALILATLATPELAPLSISEGATKADGWRFRA